MNIVQYQEKIDKLLTKLETELPEAERLSIIEDIRQMLSAFFAG